jgi:hypothetical protein
MIAVFCGTVFLLAARQGNGPIPLRLNAIHVHERCQLWRFADHLDNQSSPNAGANLRKEAV